MQQLCSMGGGSQNEGCLGPGGERGITPLDHLFFLLMEPTAGERF